MKKRRSAPQKPASARTAQSWPLLDASHCAKTFKNRDCEEPLHALWPRELWLQELGLQERCPRALRLLCSCIDIFVFASPLNSSRFPAAFPLLFHASSRPPSQARRAPRQTRLRILSLFCFTSSVFWQKADRTAQNLCTMAIEVCARCWRLQNLHRLASSQATHDGSRRCTMTRKRTAIVAGATTHRCTACRAQHRAHERTFDGNGVLHFRYSWRI